MLGKETAETNLRTLRLPCYLQLLGVDVGERDCGDESADGAVTMLLHESADAAVTMLFAAVGAETNLRTLLLPCYLQLRVDAAVTMLFAAVGGRCWGARLRRRICGRCCYHAIRSCWG